MTGKKTPGLSTLRNRDQLGEWLNWRGLIGSGVEVGSLSGEYARTIISKWNGSALYLVDPWERQPDDVYKEPVNHTNWEECYRSCIELAREYYPRVTLIKGYSPQAAFGFPDDILDFCYIDGNHGLEAITADLQAWWPKVKMGGLFGGHDYRNDTTYPQNCEVKKAVDEFARKLGGVAIHYTPPCGSWWLTKI